MAGGANVSGTLEIHNFVVAELVSAHEAAYPVLTSTASSSFDGSKLYVIVFNKSADDSVPVTVHLTGFSAAKAQYWEVDGPDLHSTDAVNETQHGAMILLSTTDRAPHVFPAHSKTAIEFSTTH